MTAIKLIHIGFPKASSSYLQQIIFKLIRKKKLLNFYNIGNIDKNYNFSYINENEDYIISCEHLAFNFYQLDKSYDYTKTIINNLKGHFGPDVQIMLILREPSALISSIYNQHARTRIGYPKTSKKDLKKYLSFKNFIYKNQDKITLFSYHKIISLFEKEFKNIFVIKHEHFHENIDNIFLRTSYTLTKKSELVIKRASLINRSLSNQALFLTFCVNKFLSYLYLDLNSIDKLYDKLHKLYHYFTSNNYKNLNPIRLVNRFLENITNRLFKKKKSTTEINDSTKRKIRFTLDQEKEYWNRFMYYLDRKYFQKNNNSDSFKSIMPEEFKRLKEEYDSIKESKIRPLIQ